MKALKALGYDFQGKGGGGLAGGLPLCRTLEVALVV
jgi:hypothetical protein